MFFYGLILAINEDYQYDVLFLFLHKQIILLNFNFFGLVWQKKRV